VQSELSEWQKDLLVRERLLLNQLYPAQKGHKIAHPFYFSYLLNIFLK
jgi:hypothetical protein